MIRSHLARAARSLALLAAIAPLAAGAQSRRAAADTADIPLAFSVPEAPAFTFLGVSPAKVSRASSARDLGAALLNAVDSTGRAVTGVAVGATLWTLLPNVTVDAARYRTSRRAYALANTQLSLGSARSTGDAADTHVALGVRTTILDRSDPMQDAAFVRSLTAALSGCLDEITAPAFPPPSAGDPALDCAAAANDTLRLRWFHNNWNKPSLSWGAGAGWRIPRSEIGSFDPLGVSAWVTGAYPLGRAGQLLAQLQYDQRNGADTLAGTRLLTYGARAMRGDRRHNLFVEAAGTSRLRTAPGVSRSNAQWSGGVEFQISSDYWLSTGFGRRYAAQDRPDRVVLIANMRWGVASAARLRMLPAYAPR